MASGYARNHFRRHRNVAAVCAKSHCRQKPSVKRPCSAGSPVSSGRLPCRPRSKYVILTLRARTTKVGRHLLTLYIGASHEVPWLVFRQQSSAALRCLQTESLHLPFRFLPPSRGFASLRSRDQRTVPIVIAILTALFLIQQFGTKFVGRFFRSSDVLVPHDRRARDTVDRARAACPGSGQSALCLSAAGRTRMDSGCWAQSSFVLQPVQKACTPTWVTAARKISGRAGAS